MLITTYDVGSMGPNLDKAWSGEFVLKSVSPNLIPSYAEMPRGGTSTRIWDLSTVTINKLAVIITTPRNSE